MLVTIENGGYKVGIESIGAELRSFVNPEGTQLIWTANPDIWKSSSPLLFPIIGNLRDGKTIIKGKEYSMPKHGIVRYKEFAINKQAENRVSFTYASIEEDMKSYPYAFVIELVYEVNKDKLVITYNITNKNDEPMPFNLGAHPGFMCPVYEGERFEDYEIRFDEPECCDSPVYDFDNMEFSFTNTKRYFDNSASLKLDYSLFEKDAVVVTNPKSKRAAIVNSTTGKGISCGISDFDIVAFWTTNAANAPYVCIEPWNGIAVCSDEGDEYTSKRSIQIAEVGQTKTYTLDIQLMGY